MTPEKEDAFLALSALSVAGLPRFSEEQEALERASLTDEEKAAILADMFGKYCCIGPRQNKRARRDLDRESIDFLISFMKSEIANTPAEEKQALMEAQTKCEADEFSDARLETFLRCEGMNAKLAAQRFIAYWQSRLEAFGPTKYLMRMTLSEALRDDLAAIEDGICCLLPFKDSSGRELIFMEACRRRIENYTSESLVSFIVEIPYVILRSMLTPMVSVSQLRAWWYVFEVASRKNNDIGRAVVNVSWDKNSTIWGFDRHVGDSFIRLEKTAWPVRVAAVHVCCSPKFIVRVMKPYVK